MHTQPASVSDVAELVDPVLEKLQKFDPDARYERERIKQTIRSLIKERKVGDVVLAPDQNHFNTIPIDSDKYKLLIAHCCSVYVDLIMQPHFVHSHMKRKQIPKHQREFASELDGEIYRLENGKGFSGSIQSQSPV